MKPLLFCVIIFYVFSGFGCALREKGVKRDGLDIQVDTRRYPRVTVLLKNQTKVPITIWDTREPWGFGELQWSFLFFDKSHTPSEVVFASASSYTGPGTADVETIGPSKTIMMNVDFKNKAFRFPAGKSWSSEWVSMQATLQTSIIPNSNRIAEGLTLGLWNSAREGIPRGKRLPIR